MSVKEARKSSEDAEAVGAVNTYTGGLLRSINWHVGWKVILSNFLCVGVPGPKESP